MESIERNVHRMLEDSYSGSETERVKYAVIISLVLFAILLVSFEMIRHIKQIFLKRVTRKYQSSKRVPPPPPRSFLGWVRHILKISETDFLYMVGLDGYMFMRFIKMCFKISLFYSFWGVFILLPIYSSAHGDLKGWGALTLGNVIHQNHALRLWWPAIFSYIFAIYVCRLLYLEYDLFVKKRLEYLIRGDRDTHPQTYYTLMVENIPSEYRSVPALREFFDTLFPESVHSVSAVLKLHQLEAMCQLRRETRNNIELGVAKRHATGNAPLIWVPTNTYVKARAQAAALLEVDEENGGDAKSAFDEDSRPPKPVRTRCGLIKVSAIDHHTFMLNILNKSVSRLQRMCAIRTEELNELESQNLILAPNLKSREVLQFLASATEAFSSEYYASHRERANSVDSGGGGQDGTLEEGIAMHSVSHGRGFRHGRRDSMDSVDDIIYPEASRSADENDMSHTLDSNQQEGSKVDDCANDDGGMDTSNYRSLTEAFFQTSYEKLENTRSVLAAEGAAAAELARQAAIQSVHDARRALESLTVRTYFSMSSTAFVTFSSRVSAGVAHQMLLSHDNHEMEVSPAPSMTDIIWSNMYAKKTQIDTRTKTASAALIVGVIFWSVVVTGIRSVFNLQTLDKNHRNSYLSRHEGSMIYVFFNDYMAVSILLTLLAVLPLIFDFVARKYERLRTESQIQQSIMGRYFAYMLANIYINVTADSILTSVKSIFLNPGSVLKVLGESLPNVSALFACMIILYTFVGLMIEFIRAWPMICFYTLTMFQDKRKCTRRQLRTGAFRAASMLYGWIYPCLLMIFMIEMIYSCIAPVISALAVVYFSFAYIMYKYQLLYVYVNEYQSGGQMWYKVFNMCIISLLCGIVTLMGYLASKKDLISGPFYLVIPLPIFISLFWRYCDRKFFSPSVNLSLEHAGIIDKYYRVSTKRGLPSPLDSFSDKAFSQPSLTEAKLCPEPYRLRSTSAAMTSLAAQSENTTYSTLHQESSIEATPNNSVTPGKGISSDRDVSTPPSYNLPNIPSVAIGEDEDMTTSSNNDSPYGASLLTGNRTPGSPPNFQMQRQMSDDDLDDEQLDMCVNDILEGISTLQDVPL